MEYSVDHIFQITVEDIRQLCYPDPGPTDVIWRENRPELCLRRRLRVNRKLPSLFTSVGSPLMGGEEPRTISVGVRALRYKNAGLERIRNAPPSPRPPVPHTNLLAHADSQNHDLIYHRPPLWPLVNETCVSGVFRESSSSSPVDAPRRSDLQPNVVAFYRPPPSP